MQILIVRMEAFPYGSAPASRALNVARLCVASGNEVTVIAPFVSTNDIDKDGLLTKEIGISVISTNGMENYVSLLKQALKNKIFDVVIRPTSIRLYNQINKILEECKVPTIFDSVEWFNASNWRLGYFDPRYYQFLIYWKYRFPKKNGVIAISRMIESYFKRYMDNVVRIPTITDCNNVKYRTRCYEGEPIKLIFAGSLDKGKDMIAKLLIAYDGLSDEYRKFVINIYGPDQNDVSRHLGSKKDILNRHKDTIKIHGKVEQIIVQEKCRESDYSFFFRQNRRSANAGFPTKLGECMTMGTPIICNDTGDISLVVENGKNGFLLKSYGIDAIKDVLISICKQSIEERERMRKETRKSAETFFDYRNYIDKINTVLSHYKYQ